MFSLPKLLLLGLMIVVVLYGFKWVGRMQEQKQRSVRKKRNDAPPAAKGSADKSAQDDVEETIQCTTCGAYVTTGSRNCGRDNCPFTG